QQAHSAIEHHVHRVAKARLFYRLHPISSQKLPKIRRLHIVYP
ncbi:MAG: hypothetical protein ACI9AX_001111, partial [Polaromonas sp.]